MWFATTHGIRHEDGDNTFSFPILSPDWSKFSGECLSLEREYHDIRGYDDWVQHYPREHEIDLITDIIASLKVHPRWVHVAGISARESVEILREYYRELGYEDSLAKNYILPDDVLLTASTTLRHILWCEKDKTLLEKKDVHNMPYYALVPPLRTPADLRSLQQATRMGIIMGIEVSPGDEIYISQIFSKQILTPFQLTQIVAYSWEHHGFSGSTKTCSLEFPIFSGQEDMVF